MSGCATWRSRLESSRMANVFPSWRGSLYKVIVLSADGLAGSTKYQLKLPGLKILAWHPYLPFSSPILYYRAQITFLFSFAEYPRSFRPS
jgi:hypothetical protein